MSTPRARPRQRNCQNEPHYPGTETVTFSIRYPDLTCHHATAGCPIEPPHRIAECGEWARAETPEGMRREIANEPRLRLHRPGLLPGMGRDAGMDQRVFDAAMMRSEGLTFVEIGRRVGRSSEVVRHYCHWYVTSADADAYRAKWGVEP